MPSESPASEPQRVAATLDRSHGGWGSAGRPPYQHVYAGGAGIQIHLAERDAERTLCGKPVAETRPPFNREATCRSCRRKHQEANDG